MRHLRFNVAFVTAVLVSLPLSLQGQVLASGSPPGQVFDGITIRVGMAYDEAVELLSARYELRGEPFVSQTLSMDAAVFAPPGQPSDSGTVQVVGHDGLVYGIRSIWTPSEASDAAFAARLEALVALLSSQEGAGLQLEDCRVSLLDGSYYAPLRKTQIVCGRHTVEVARGTSPDNLRPSLQLSTR